MKQFWGSMAIALSATLFCPRAGSAGNVRHIRRARRGRLSDQARIPPPLEPLSDRPGGRTEKRHHHPRRSHGGQYRVPTSGCALARAHPSGRELGRHHEHGSGKICRPAGGTGNGRVRRATRGGTATPSFPGIISTSAQSSPTTSPPLTPCAAMPARRTTSRSSFPAARAAITGDLSGCS